MSRAFKRAAMGTVVVCAALACVTAAAAAIKTTTHPTTLTVEHTYVSGDGRLTVTGRIHSDSRNCSFFRQIGLIRQEEGRNQLQDAGLSSINGGWATRTGPGAADGSPFFVKTPRESFESVRVGPNGHRSRRTIICEAAQQPVTYTP